MDRFEYELVVPPDVIDVFGHVNNIEYVRWVQDAAVKHSDAVGLSWDVYLELGAAFVIRRHEIDYLRSARVGETLRIATYIVSHTRITANRATEISHANGERILTAMTTWVYVGLDTLRPKRIDQRIVRAFTGPQLS
jgi:acyl-CoA thioester hydrolase